jgi:hypothetical protein
MTENPLQESPRPIQEKRKHDVLDVEFSLVAALLIDAHPNTCFDNAWRTFVRCFPELFSPDGLFIEGWWVIELPDRVVMNEHGWCEWPDGRVVDPTVVLLLRPEIPVYYFPGVTRSWDEVNALVQAKKWFPYVRFGEYGTDGLRHPDYKAAHDAAMRKMISLAHATNPPKPTEQLSAQDRDKDPYEEECEVRVFFLASEQDGEEEEK